MTRDGETFFFKGIVYESIIENIKKGMCVISIVCFMSTILAAIILFVFLGVKELVLGTMSMEERVRSQQGVAIQTYMYILLFIGLILISYTVSNYSRIRIKDYGMFMVFGEEKKDIIRMIILEYGIICGISW